MSRVGNMPITVPAGVEVKIDGNHIAVKGPKGSLERDIHPNMKVELEINGVGYRAQKQGNKLVMSLGYSHPVEMEAPAGITFDLTDANHIVVRGIDKELVGQVANEVRSKRPPEVYRGKGIKYATEHIRRKEGKAGKK